VDAEVGGVVVEGGAGGAGVDGEADGAEDAVAGGAIPFHVGAGAAVSSASPVARRQNLSALVIWANRICFL